MTTLAISATTAGLLPAPAGAASSLATPATSTVRVAGSASVAVASLRATAARTQVTVRNVRRSAQARWIDGVLDDRIVSLNGCVADVAPSALSHRVYRATVQTLCAGGVSTTRAAAAKLTRSKPWYRIRVTAVPVVAFTFTTTLDNGRGAPVEKALTKLPSTGFVYVDGDDTSMAYVGQGVTQAQLDAARAAFAAELGLATSAVTVAPLHLG